MNHDQDPEKVFQPNRVKRILDQAKANGVPLLKRVQPPRKEEPLQIKVGHNPDLNGKAVVAIVLSRPAQEIVLTLEQIPGFIQNLSLHAAQCASRAYADKPCPRCKLPYKEHAIGPAGPIDFVCPEPIAEGGAGA